MELDHFFVVARRSGVSQDGGVKHESDALISANLAREWADALVRAGFSEGSSNRHPGQGTSNYRFFFAGFMVEFLYIDDAVELGSDRGAVLELPDRFSDLSVSPFGVCTRRTQASVPDSLFPYTSYHPQYLPDSLHIQVASRTLCNEPLMFHLPFVAGRGEPVKQVSAEPMMHHNGAVHLSSLVIEVPFAPSAALVDIARNVAVEIVESNRHFAHLVFDKGTRHALSLPATMNISITL